jgi:predicted transcriptional regulator YdeE
MAFEIHEMAALEVTGPTLRTNNMNEREQPKIPAFWQNFFASGTVQQLIGDKEPSALYVVYTEYESDYMGDYTMFLGFNSEEVIGDEFKTCKVPAGRYAMFVAESHEDLLATWVEIWNAPLKRVYKADFQVHDMATGIVKIYVGIE